MVSHKKREGLIPRAHQNCRLAVKRGGGKTCQKGLQREPKGTVWVDVRCGRSIQGQKIKRKKRNKRKGPSGGGIVGQK